MKVALVNDHFATISAGGQHRIQNLGLGLLRLGHEVLFVSPDGARNYTELPLLRNRQSVWRQAGLTGWERIWLLLERQISELDLVVFELPMPVSKAFPVLLTKLNGIPAVLDFGDIWFGRETKSELLRLVHNGLYRVLCKAATAVTVPTHAMARFLTNYARVEVAKIPFPIDVWGLFNPSLYTGDPPADVADWARGKDLVIYSGTLALEKGADLIPIVAERLVRTRGGRDLGFIVVGEGPLKDLLKNQVEDRAIREHFRFVGTRGGKDLAHLLSVGSVALSLSPKHGVDFAPRNMSKIAAYLAMGKPVVAVADPSAEECIEHGKTGYLVPPENLHAAVLEILNGPSLQKEMSELARKRAESTYDCIVVATNLLALINLDGVRQDKTGGSGQDAAIRRQGRS
jgi:glycosyltransferase involved in cell wall biosynthesis